MFYCQFYLLRGCCFCTGCLFELLLVDVFSKDFFRGERFGEVGGKAWSMLDGFLSGHSGGRVGGEGGAKNGNYKNT